MSRDIHGIGGEIGNYFPLILFSISRVYRMLQLSPGFKCSSAYIVFDQTQKTCQFCQWHRTSAKLIIAAPINMSEPLASIVRKHARMF